MKRDQFVIEFHASGRGKARCPADPQFPDGVRATMARSGAPSCTIEFPYPAPECGHWQAVCRLCGFSIAITAAGRADDPRSLTVNCLRKAGLN